MKDLFFLSDICEVNFDAPSPSTFGSGGNLACAVYPRTIEQLEKAVCALNSEGMEYYILGACSNTLIDDSGVDGVVISTQKLKGKELDGERLYLLAGERMTVVCRYVAENSLSGIEGLCSIPGSMGGGLVMNCGAFGRELGDVVEYADILVDGKVERVNAKDLGFSYRHSKVKDIGVVVGMGIKLVEGDRKHIGKDMKGYAIARAMSQPKGKSLGSVFKKTGNTSAGYYIDKAGLKGYKIGGAQISNIHANFILNIGGATSTDFLLLADYARQEVDKQFGVKLKYEVEYLPAVSSIEHI
ncbi:MAG: UDP-N-acetylmuramate dehydrogenase [Clostridia bacterium]|nr:UDP-N-acetylmuramate dehydrogenase [Clostridia bacterium]